MSRTDSKAFITERCTGCGVCISRCPEKAIEFYTERHTKRARVKDGVCTGCGICPPHCQFSAIVMKKIAGHIGPA